LLHRRRTGEGQYVENPQLNATMAHMAHAVRRAGTVLGAGRLDPLQRGLGALDRLYPTADGWICLVALAPRHRRALERFAGVEPGGARDADALGERVEALLAERKTADALRELSAAGVPAAEPLPYHMAGFLRDPRNRASGRAAELPHPRHGHIRELAVLVRVSDAALPPHRLAPALGEHTDEILGWLGYGAAQIAALRARGAAR
jgi:crotonobetainyl-CoA:carnitine CoA-transferase CaiB-like acyl-CoA transferase